MYRSARRAGVTVRSGVDCLIAACAVRHGLTVLHHDRDFDQLARVVPLETRRV
jgi:predicted nucleic acid-binding protein